MNDRATLEISLAGGEEGGYSIELRFAQPGDRGEPNRARGQAQFPPKELRALWAQPEAYGQLLTAYLLADPALRSFFDDALAIAQQAGWVLRLRLWIDRSAADLDSLCWETLQNPKDGSFLAINQNRPLSRYLQGEDWSPVQLSARRQARALVVVANPTDVAAGEKRVDGHSLARVRVDAELERARQGLQGHDDQGIGQVVELASDPGDPGRVSLDNLVAHLSEGYDVLYLACHGALLGKDRGDPDSEREPFLVLEKLDGDADVVRGEALVERLRNLDASRRPALVVLASCQSGGEGPARTADREGALAALGPRLAQVGIPAVLAMQGDVQMDTVAEFMPTFFAQLVDHGRVDVAMAAARERVQERNDWWVPVLFTRLPDGQLFYARVDAPSMATERQALDDYLALAVKAYEAEMAQAVLGLPTRFDEPYKFLDAFTLEDAHLFFGRHDAQQKLYDTLLQERLTVVHAKSGAGKSSLLQAGLGPSLIREGRLPVYARAHKDPVHAIKQEFARHVKELRPALLSQLTLHEFLKVTCGHLSRRIQELVIVLDQFEEFFVSFPERAHRQPFIEELADCYDDDSLPLRIVVALRQDYLSDMADFDERIPTILANRYRLDTMSREEARAAITQPLTLLDQPVEPEPALLEALLDDLARGGMELPHLQILCTQLWRGLEDGETRITLKSYKALGRAEGILAGYLNSELAKLPGGQRRFAREVLKELVSSEATKRVLGYTVLAARIEAEAEELDRVLDWLVNRRLLHRDEDEVEGEIQYEMVHEYLIEEIRQWIGREDMIFKQAQELLAREVASWRVHGTRIPGDRLELLYAQRERLKGLDDESWICILVSALEAEYAVEEWASLAGEVGEKPLVAALGDPQEETRRAAMRGLGVIWEVPAVSRLGNESLDVRRTAAGALGELGDPRAVAPLIAVLRDEDDGVRQAAAGALGALGESAVASLIAALQDEDDRAHQGAAGALGVLGEPAVPPLIAALQDENDRARQGAAGALGELGDPRAVEPLIAALGDEVDRVRQGAAMALGRLGDPRAVEPLIAALQDRDVGVRHRAAGGLGELGDPRAVESLIAALQDRDDAARQGATGALGELGDPRAVEPLIVALRDEDNGVREEAARALGELGDPAAGPLIAALRDEDARVRQGAARALGELGEPAVASLVAALQDEDDRVREGAAKVLGELGEPAVEPLIVALRDKNERVREGASMALGQLGDPRAMEPLIAVLGDDDWTVRHKAATALGQLGEPAVEPLIAALRDRRDRLRGGAARALGELGDRHAVVPLIAVLRNRRDNARQWAARALGDLGDQRAVAPLITALRDRDGSVRQKAAGALGQLGDPRAVGPLIDVLRDENDVARQEATWALGKLGEPAVEPLIAVLRDEDWHVRHGAASALGKLGEPAVEPLIAVLGDEDWHVREGAAAALGKLGDPRAVEPLIDVLRDEVDQVRRWAAMALEGLGDPRAVEPLIDTLRDEDGDVRWRAARALGELGDPRAVEPLIAVLGDEDWNVSKEAVVALGKLGEPAVEPLIAALRDEVGPVREAAAKALGELGNPRAVTPLIAALQDKDDRGRQGAAAALGRLGEPRAVEPLIAVLGDEDHNVRSAAARALGKLGEPAVEPLIAALGDDDRPMPSLAAWALGELGNPRAVTPLIAALGDEDWRGRQGAAAALGRLGDPRAVEPLIAALGDEDHNVRSAAAEALGKLGEPAVEPLIAALEDENDTVREGAAFALEVIGGSEALAALEGREP